MFSHYGVSNHELTQIFYDGLGPQDKYLLNVASGGTIISKFKDDTIKLIEMVEENSHHSAPKPFKRGALPNGQFIDAKSVKTDMLLERIKKMVEVQNLLLEQLNFCNGSQGLAPVSLQEVSPCVNCLRLDYVDLDYPAMVVLG